MSNIMACNCNCCRKNNLFADVLFDSFLGRHDEPPEIPIHVKVNSIINQKIRSGELKYFEASTIGLQPNIMVFDECSNIDIHKPYPSDFSYEIPNKEYGSFVVSISKGMIKNK